MKDQKRFAGSLETGAAKVNITPGEPIWMAGWATRDKPSQGVSAEVFAKALALRDETGQVSVLLTTDLLGFSKAMVDTLTQRARDSFGLERRSLILNASHSHSAPLAGDLLPLYFDLPAKEREVMERYTEFLYDRIIEAIDQALESLAPAVLAFEQGLAGFAVNRRRSRPGGRSLPGVVDHDVPVLSVRSTDGALRAVVFGYSCHATAIEDGKVNGDYPGLAQAAIETMHPGAVALFVAGCGADANPLPRFRPGLAESYGHILAQAVHEVLGGQMRPVTGPLRTVFAEVALPLQRPPAREELEAMLPGREGVKRREVENLLTILARGEQLQRSCSFPIHVWQFGSDLTFIALAGEPVADYSLRFREAYGWDSVWVSGFNDELVAYIPSLRVLREGGYEGTTGMMEYGLPSPFGSAVEEVIAEAVHELVQETSGTPGLVSAPGRFQ